jgi:phosphotransferase system enzyme I (PtsI)
MRILRGQPISSGYAEGKAFVYKRRSLPGLPPSRIAPAQVSEEHRRLREALERSSKELLELRERVLAELGRAEADVFAAHGALLKDDKLVERIKRRVEQDLVSVEHAVDAEVSDLMRLLSQAENQYMQERAADVQDVGRRVLRHLAGEPGDVLASIPPHSVVVAEELMPSDTLNLDRAHVAALVTERGGSTSHMAILARSLGIPAVTGIENACERIPDGSEVLVDGVTGTVTLGAAEPRRRDFVETQRQLVHWSGEIDREKGRECVTLDGTHVRLLANIGRPLEAGEVLEHNLEGVGLFRTEYLFLDSEEPPDLQEQMAAYEQVAQALPGLPVVIRTLDVGGDKKPPFLTPEMEGRLRLGQRGLRFSLMEGTLLAVQLRAIVEVFLRHGQVGVLFPMVVGASDLEEALKRLRQTARELGAERTPPVGTMIETPSSLFELDEILRQVDFVSVGTNDLAQFMLAADRSAVDLLTEEALLHPSVLRALRRVVEAAAAHHRPVSVCGEAAGNPPLACLLVGLGIRELSMAPRRSARVRYGLRKHRLDELETLARQAIRNESARENALLLEPIRREQP